MHKLKPLLKLPLIIILCGLTACGSQHSTSRVASKSYLNDGDAENVNDGDADNRSVNHEDGDGDSSKEYEKTSDNGHYHDSDDGSILSWGRAANAADSKTIAAVVKHYYSALAANDGKTGCSIIIFGLAKAMAEDYAYIYDPGAKTCPPVLASMFRRLNRQSTGMVDVTGVRIHGTEALALLGSRTLPASYIYLTRESGVWKVAGFVGTPLP